MKNRKNNEGITLIALIITIIVMMILVGVTVNVAMNGGLFNTADDATKRTEKHLIYDQIVDISKWNSNGTINVKGTFDEIENKFGDENVITIEPSNEEEMTQETDSVIFTIKGKKDIYKYKITTEEIEILNEEKVAQVPETYLTTLDGLGEGVTLVGYEDLTGDLKSGADAGKISAVIQEEIKDLQGNITKTLTAVVPVGYNVSTTDGEDTISKGLVISDSKMNEFVWVPLTGNFTNTYNKPEYDYSEPTELSADYIYNSTTIGKCDSQEVLTFFYGDDERFKYPSSDAEKNKTMNNFAYKAHYEEMVLSVNKYDGFYIGRYETTYDNLDEFGIPESIGTKRGKNILTATNIIKTGENQMNGQQYLYRWYGLYYAQRNSSVDGNKGILQTNMIWLQQWDEMLEFLGTDATSTLKSSESRQSTAGTVTYNGSYDKINNIYDLRRHYYDSTGAASGDKRRVSIGGRAKSAHASMYGSSRMDNYPSGNDASRLVLYIN